MSDAFAFLRSGLDRHAAAFDRGLALLERYEDEGLLTKTEHDGLKAVFNNVLEDAWKNLIRERFTYAGRYQSLTEAERDLEQKLFMPQAHTVGGYLKRAEAAAKADGAMRTAMLNLLREAAPLGARVVALKEKIGKRAPKPTKTSIARDQRAADAMTCQCCFRDILANTGKIAHHGYERPVGMGFQTNSCYGALQAPFEVSRDALGALITDLTAYLAGRNDYLSKVQKEEVAIAWSFADKTQPLNWRGRRPSIHLTVTRETFEALATETAEKRDSYANTTFDHLKAALVAEIESDIHNTALHIERLQERYDGWRQTHQRVGDQWVAIAQD